MEYINMVQENISKLETKLIKKIKIYETRIIKILKK
jgi:hypothetical protein